MEFPQGTGFPFPPGYPRGFPPGLPPHGLLYNRPPFGMPGMVPMPFPPPMQLPPKPPKPAAPLLPTPKLNTPGIPGAEQTTIYVGKISAQLDEEFIKKVLEKCGKVVNWRRVTDPVSGQLKGFGFCDYENQEGALRAIRILNDLKIGDKNLLIKADDKTQKSLDAYVARKKEEKDKKPAAETEKNEEQEEDNKILEEILQMEKERPSGQSGPTDDKSGPGPTDKETLVNREIKNFRERLAQKEQEKKAREKEEEDYRLREMERERRERARERARKRDERDQERERELRRREREEREFREREKEWELREREKERERERRDRELIRERERDKERYFYLEQVDERDRKERERRRWERDKEREEDEVDRMREVEEERERRLQEERVLRLVDLGAKPNPPPPPSPSPSPSSSSTPELPAVKTGGKDAEEKKFGSTVTNGTSNASPSSSFPSSSSNISPSTLPSSSPTTKPFTTSSSSVLSSPLSLSSSANNQGSPSQLDTTFDRLEEARKLEFNLSSSGGVTGGGSGGGGGGAGFVGAPAKKKTSQSALSSFFNPNEPEEIDDLYTRKKRPLVKLDYPEDEDKKKTKIDEMKSVIERIPTEKSDLFAFEINWKIIDDAELVEKKMRPWVTKKIIEYLGEEEKTLIDFILSKIVAHTAAPSLLEQLSLVLDEEAEVFVVKLWRFLIFEMIRAQDLSS